MAFTQVIAGDCWLWVFFVELVGRDVFGDGARHRRAQAGQVGATVTLRNVVGKHCTFSRGCRSTASTLLTVMPFFSALQ